MGFINSLHITARTLKSILSIEASVAVPFTVRFALVKGTEK